MSVLQTHWDTRAAANFVLGGAGAGLLVCSLLSPQPGAVAVALALALIALGLGAVWLEIGRKLRAIHVFFNPFTSWMTRESLAAAAAFVFGIAFLVLGNEPLHLLAAAAAAAFLWCQGRILHAAKGIPAWRTREVVPLIVATGLAEGSALALFFTGAPAALLLCGLAVIARALAFARYRDAVRLDAFDSAARPLFWSGALALVLLPASMWLPPAAPPAAIAILAAGAWLKFTLVTRAAFKQDFTLPHLPVRGIR